MIDAGFLQELDRCGRELLDKEGLRLHGGYLLAAAEKLRAAAHQAEAVPPEVVKDAERLRGLHRMTSLIGTPTGIAYQEAMEAKANEVYDALDGDLSKSTIEQYRQILDAGLSAAAQKEAEAAAPTIQHLPADDTEGGLT